MASPGIRAEKPTHFLMEEDILEPQVFFILGRAKTLSFRLG